MSSGQIALVLGGARSGKSSFAQAMAKDSTCDLIYIATAQALDAEMPTGLRDTSQTEACAGKRWNVRWVWPVQLRAGFAMRPGDLIKPSPTRQQMYGS